MSIVGTLIEKLLVSVQADFSNLDAGFRKATAQIAAGTDKISKDLERIGQKTADVGKRLTTQMTLPIAAIGALSIKAASDAEETQSMFEAVFKDQTATMEEWASVTAKSLNRSTVDLKRYAANFQDTFVPLGMARDDAALLSQQMTILGEDLASFKNLPTEDVMRSLQSAIVGNHESVLKFGVVIKQNTLDQELMNMGIMGGVKAATEQEKALARLNLIMKGTADAQGDAARTSGSFANQLKGFQAQAREAAIVVGNALLPAATQLLEMVTNLARWFAELSPEMQQMILMAAGIVAALGPVLIVLGSFASALGAIIKLAPLVMAAGRLIGAAIALAGGPITIAITAIGALVAAYLLFRDEIHTAVETAYNTVDNFLGGRLSSVLDAAVSFFQGWWDSVKLVFKAFGQLVTGDFSGFLSTMVEAAGTWLSTLKDLFLNILTGIIDVWKMIFGQIDEWTGGWLSSTYEAFATGFGKVKDVTVSIFEGLRDAVMVILGPIIDSVQWVADKITWIMGNSGKKAGEDFRRNQEEQLALLAESYGVSMEEMEKRTAQMTQRVNQNLSEGMGIFTSIIKAGTQESSDDFEQLYTDVVGNSYIPDMIDEVGDHARRLGTELVDPVSEATSDTATEFEELAQRVTNAMDAGVVSPAQEAADAAETIFEELGGNVVGPLASAVEESSGLFDTLRSHLDKFLDSGKFSVSDFMQDVSNNVIKSTTETLMDSLESIINDWLTSLMDGISQGFGSSSGGNGFGSFLNSIASGFSSMFGGGKAVGGLMMPGKIFNVNERGGEAFAMASQPTRVHSMNSAAEQRARGSNGSSVVNFNFPPGTDVESFRRSEGQIAATASRALGRGRRNQ